MASVADIPVYITIDNANYVYFTVNILTTAQTFSLINNAVGGITTGWPFTTFTKTTAVDDTIFAKYSPDGVPVFIRKIPYYIFGGLHIRFTPVGSLFYVGHNVATNQLNQTFNLATDVVGGNTSFTFNITTHNNTSRGSLLIKYTAEILEPPIEPSEIISVLRINSGAKFAISKSLKILA